MCQKRNWTEAIIVGIKHLRYTNIVHAQGMILAPSGDLNRYVREYLESEGGIIRKIRLRDFWNTDLGEEVREKLKGTSYIGNIVLYELEPDILERIAHQLMTSSPRLVLRSEHGGRKRIVSASCQHCRQSDSGSWTL